MQIKKEQNNFNFNYNIMQIEFTKEQYEKLLKIIYCWDMMINWTRPYDERILDIDNLCSHIYSKAKDFWYESKVDYLEEDKLFVASCELEAEEELNNYIDNYDENNENFWDELTFLLVDRDLKEKFKNPLLNNIQECRKELFDFYWDEFSDNGIENLRIVKKKINRFF